MSGMNAFLKQNKKTENEKVLFAASKQFVDEKGNPIMWEMKPLTSRKAQEIRNECNKIVGKKVIVDNALWQRRMAAECTVFPNLYDAELQDSYGVMDPADLLMEMLDNDGEFQTYFAKCAEISGYNISDKELVEQAKN